MRRGLGISLLLAFSITTLIVPQVPAGATDCETPASTDASDISPQHLVAAPNGDVDVTYSKHDVSEIGRVRYDAGGDTLRAIALVDAGADRPHRILLAGSDIYYTLTDDDTVGKLGAQFADNSTATLLNGDLMCSATGIEQGADGDLWVAETTITTDAIERINLSPLQYVDVPLGAAYDTPDCLPQELTTAPNGRIWFSCNDGGELGAVNPSNDQVFGPYFQTELSGRQPHAMITGPDDFLYLTEHEDGAIDRVNPGNSPTIRSCDLPGSGKQPADITFVENEMDPGNFDLWFTLTASDKLGLIFDADTLTGSAWDSCADLDDDNYSQYALSDDTQPKGITFNDTDERVWFTEAWTDSVGWVDPASHEIVECWLPTTSGWGGAENCHHPSSSLLGGGGDLLDAADELSPALDLASEQDCQTITHSLSGTLSGSVLDPETQKPLDLTGKFEAVSEVACEDSGKGEASVQSVEISDPVLSFSPLEIGTYTRDGSDVSTSDVEGVCLVGNTYFMCSVTLAGSWIPQDDETPSDVEAADIASASLTIVAE
jgi:streptogramin lyase